MLEVDVRFFENSEVTKALTPSNHHIVVRNSRFHVTKQILPSTVSVN